MLGLIQRAETLRLDAVLTSISQHLLAQQQKGKLTADRVGNVMIEVSKLQNLSSAITKLAFSDADYAYLKAAHIFTKRSCF